MLVFLLILGYLVLVWLICPLRLSKFIGKTCWQGTKWFSKFRQEHIENYSRNFQWSQFTDRFSISPQQFYNLLEEAIDRRQISDIQKYRVYRSESGMFSPRREYLRIHRGEHICDISSFLIGTSLCVSCRSIERLGLFWRLILWIPFLGLFLIRICHPLTYYRSDRAQLFQRVIQSAITEVMEEINSVKGSRYFPRQ